MPAANSTKAVSVRTTTTDGTIATGATYRTKPGFAYLVVANVIATDGTTSAGYRRIGVFEHSTAGTLGLVGSVTSDHTAEDIAAPMDCTLDVDDTTKDIRVRITGDPGRTIKWNIALDVYQTF